VERLNLNAPYPYAGMIRIRFKGSARESLLSRTSQAKGHPSGIPNGNMPVGMFAYSSPPVMPMPDSIIALAFGVVCRCSWRVES